MPATEGDKPSASWWKRKAWILPVWAWILVGLFGVGAISSAFDESEDDASDTITAAVATDSSVAAESTEAATTTETPTTTTDSDDSADVSRWSIYAMEAAGDSSSVINKIGDIATSAGSDISGWISGGYSDAAIDAWVDATSMLESWDERPQPAPERVAECDALANQMFVATLDIADVFSDMAIEGSTDVDLLSQVTEGMNAVTEMAAANTACINRL